MSRFSCISHKMFTVLVCAVLTLATVRAGEAKPLPVPEIEPRAGWYCVPILVEIEAKGGRGVEVRYTVDGTDPTPSSWLVAGPVQVTDDTTVKARSYAPGNPAKTPSPIVTSSYRISTALVTARPSFNPGTGLYVDTVRVALATATPGAWITYTTDGSEPTLRSTRYAGLLAVTTPTTLRARAFGGWFNVKIFGQTIRLPALFPSGVATATYNLQVGTPAFSIAGGLYREAQTVAVATPTPSANLTYTLDGSEPTASSPRVITPLAVTRSQTVRVRGFRDGFTPSAIATASYELKVREPVIAPPGGTYSTDTLTANVTTTDAASQTRYTVNGQTPTAESPLVAGPINVNESQTVTARSFRDGWTPSDPVVAAYRLRVATPTLTAGGLFTAPLSVTASSATLNAILRYTVDGSTPTALSPVLPPSLIVDQITNLAVVGFRDGFEPSSSAIALYQFKVQTPALSLASGTYRATIVVSVSSLTPGAALRYTTDGTDPGEGSALFSGPLAVTRSLAITIRGFRTGYLPSDIVRGTYELKAQEPVIAPPAGIYTGTVTATVTAADPADTVRFTLDGSLPGIGAPLVTAPIVIDRVATLTARAFRDGWTPSEAVPVAYRLRVTMPLLSPAGGTFTEAATVTATVETSDAAIRYTTDGTAPTVASPVMPASLLIDHPTTLRVVGFRDGFEPSDVVSAPFAFFVATPTATLSAGIYRTEQVAGFTCATPGAALTFTTDGSDPLPTSAAYTGPLGITKSTTVRVRGFHDGFLPSAVTVVAYELKAPEPAITPAGGSFFDTTSATVSGLAGTTVRYTDDGTTPSEADADASNPIAITRSATIAARAFKAGWTPSDTVSAVFMLRVAEPVFSPVPGGYVDAVTVMTSTNTTGSILVYTLDGTDPTEAGTRVPDVGLTIDHTTVVKVRGFRDGFTPSAIVSGSYRFPPMLRVVTAAETVSEAIGTVTIQVLLSEPSDQEVSFSYAQGSGTASLTDLGPIPDAVRVVIPAGTTQASFQLSVIDDNIYESDETAIIELIDLNGAVPLAGQASFTLTITNNDPPPTVSFAETSGTFAEDAGFIQIPLVLSAASEVSLEVDVLANAGTARADLDFIPGDHRVTFSSGETTATCRIILLDDPDAEGDEYAVLTLRQVGVAPVGAASTYRLGITSAEVRLESVVWQQKARESVAKTNTDPPAASRIYALLGVAQRRAVRAISGTSLSEQAAVVAASAQVLSRAFPSFASTFRADAQNSVDAPTWSGYPQEDVLGTNAVGRVIANQVMDAASSDGAVVIWTGTPPVGPGYWFTSWAYAQPPLRPLWGQVRPWFLASGDEFRPLPPPAFGSQAFVDGLAEVRAISDHRTDQQLLIASRWAEGPGTPTPSGKWCDIACDLAIQHRMNEASAAHLFGLLGATMMDAGIACWDVKYAHWLIRPYQADRSIITPIGQPNFPSYVSGHATFSGAAAEILASTFPDAADSVRAMAEEAALSRLYGGIHYRFDNDVGLVLGRQIAAKALADDADGTWLRELTPQIGFLSPAPSQILSSGSLTIQASVSDDMDLASTAIVASLRTDAGTTIPATFTRTTGTTVTISITPDSPLPEGLYRAEITATDEDGHVGSGTLSFGVDPDGPPVITILTPTDRDLVGMAVPVVMTGRINQGVVSATINGTELDVAPDHTFSVSLTVDPNTGIRRPLTLMGGLNELLVRAMDASGKIGTARIDVLVDDHAPTIAIETPADNSQTTSATVHVAGRVQDLVLGQVTSDNMTVTVNGEPAQIRSGNFLLPNVALVAGLNLITVEARDQAGNVSQAIITVTQVPTRGIRMDLVSGDLQETEMRTPLVQPLVVRLSDQLGAAVDRHAVTFTVSRGDGQLAGSVNDERRSITVLSDINGEAQASFIVGGNAGVGNQRVAVTSAGVLSGVTFTASATHGPIKAVYTMMGDRQTGFAGKPVPWPLVVSVQDFAGNPAAGVTVQFQVISGTSTLVPAQWVNAIFRNPLTIIGEAQTIEFVTDKDGRAAVTVILGQEIGPETAEIKASVVGHPEARTTTLVASSVTGTGNPADTALAGIVLSTEHQPIKGVTLVIDGTTIGAVSDEKGKFIIVGAPAGHRHLMVNGTTANHDQIRYPTIGFEVDLLTGATLSMPMPIYLPTMDRSNEVLAGGDTEVTLQLPGMPGVEVIIAPHSTIRSDGERGPVWMWTSPVNAQAIPMPPPGGIVPTLAATLQPSGTRLDPPARIRWPNMQSMRPGSQAFMLSFDHDLGAFVSQGTMTATSDGSYLLSDVGSGLTKAGWHFPCDTPIPTGNSKGTMPTILDAIAGPDSLVLGESASYKGVFDPPHIKDAITWNIETPMEPVVSTTEIALLSETTQSATVAAIAVSCMPDEGNTVTLVGQTQHCTAKKTISIQKPNVLPNVVEAGTTLDVIIQPIVISDWTQHTPVSAGENGITMSEYQQYQAALATGGIEAETALQILGNAIAIKNQEFDKVNSRLRLNVSVGAAVALSTHDINVGVCRLIKALTITPRITISTGSNRITAGGKDNKTDRTEIKIIKMGGPRQIARLQLVGGEGTQRTEQRIFGSETIQIGGSRPARLIGNKIELVGGSTGSSADFAMDSGIEYKFTLFSSNHVGEWVQVQVTIDGIVATSTAVSFVEPKMTIVIYDSDNSVLGNRTMVPYRKYTVRSTSGWDGSPTSQHSLIFLCKSIQVSDGSELALDKDGDQNIIPSEFTRMNRLVWIDNPQIMTTSANGNTEERKLMIQWGGVDRLNLVLIDTDIYVPTTP